MISISNEEYDNHHAEVMYDEQILVDELKIRILTTKPKVRDCLEPI